MLRISLTFASVAAKREFRTAEAQPFQGQHLYHDTCAQDGYAVGLSEPLAGRTAQGAAARCHDGRC